MEAEVSGQESVPSPNARRFGSDGVVLLQIFALSVMVIPSDTVIGAIGAAGYPASLVGGLIFLAFLAALLFGVHSPHSHRHPIQMVLCLFSVSVLVSYLLMDRGVLTTTQLTGGDRTLIRLAVIAGVVSVAAEWLKSLDDVHRVLRALCWGGAVCGAVAALQFWASVDLSQYLRELPGFTLNQDNPAILARGALNRVAGTAITPIELGVVAGMLVPIAVYLAVNDRDSTRFRRWTPVVLISLAVATSVSRSAIISVVLAFGVLLVLMPTLTRLTALVASMFAVVGAFMAAPGLIGTLASFFSAGSSDSSIQYRLVDYPVADRLWEQAPWFGHGGGTYIPVDSLYIFDNQYLMTLVELGLFGLVAVAVFFFVPAAAALIARARSRVPELRQLCAALAGAGLAAAASSFTFDSLSFPMFVNVYALVIGLIGACWRLTLAEVVPASPALSASPLRLTPSSDPELPGRAAATTGG